MPSKNLLFAASLMLFSTGCSHYILPVNHLETPEVRGEGKIGRLEGPGIFMGNDLSKSPVMSKADATKGETAVPLVRSGFNTGIGFVKAWSDKIDIGVRFQPQAPFALRFKYQLTGHPEIQSKKGDFSTAVAFAPGFLMAPNSVSFFSYDMSYIAGYRLGDHHLISLSPFFTSATLSGVRQNVAGSTGGGPGPDSITANQYGVGLGYQYTVEDLFLRPEIAYAKGSVVDSQVGGFYLGALLGLQL